MKVLQLAKSYTPHQHHFLDICRFAYLNGASDIHFEPNHQGCCIRIRVDGILNEIKSINRSTFKQFHTDSRMLIGFDPHILGSPQDARFSHPEEMVDFRANLMPVKYGEKIVLRLLERGKDFHLDNYPLYEGPKQSLEKSIQKKQGLIIVSGPTGSGKSTLLYSALGSLNRKTLNISTIEDPIEYELEGLNQTEVDKENGLTFDTGLRALMRQDPDVIMVGEIRDQETAEAAIHAASTGHLVFSTIHANSSAEILTRLSGLGVSEDIVRKLLLFSSAQRLPKKLCNDCKTDDLDSFEVLRSLFPDKSIEFTPKTSKGCETCLQTGIKGRVLLFEYMKRSESPSNSLESIGSLKESAFLEIKQGTISVGEAYGQFS